MLLAGTCTAVQVASEAWTALMLCLRCVQVHGIGGAVGVWFYALMAKQDFVYELYGMPCSTIP